MSDNQLRTLRHVGVFNRTPQGKRPQLVKPRLSDGGYEPKAQAALSYLHVNCGTCHRRGGGGTSKFELLAHKAISDKYLVGARPTQGTFGIVGAQVVAPGDPCRSVLYYRMAKLGRGRMPHFGSNVVDHQGLKIIEDWITNIKVDDSSKVPPRELAARKRRAEERNTFLDFSVKARSKRDPRFAKLADQLLTTPSGAMEMLTTMRKGRLNSEHYRFVIEKGSKHSDPRIRDLFEPFLPEEKRIKRLGTLVDANALLARTGDIARGRKIFFATKNVSCANCHQVGDKGKNIGPDLSHVGKKLKRGEILESILHPSRKIDAKFRLYLVETKKGTVHTGMLASRTKDAVTLKDAQGKLLRIDTADIEMLVSQRKSIMPELLLRDMTMVEALDLLEFLASLK